MIILGRQYEQFIFIITLKDMIRNRSKQTSSHATEDLMTM